MIKKQRLVRVFVSVFVLSVLLACNKPSEQLLVSDFEKVFIAQNTQGLTPVVAKWFAGEGDSDNAYIQVIFDVVADTDVNIEGGWFTGSSFKKNQKLTGGEVMLLYQKYGSDGWKLSKWELKKLPQ